MINKKNEKAGLFMKKHILIVMAALLCTWLFCGCEEKELTGKNEQGSKEQYLIVTPFGGIEEDTAKLISLCLEEKGYASVIEHVDAVPSERDGVIGVIAVGCEARVAEGVPYVRASFDMGEEPKENVIAPCLTSGNVARAALLLLPEASRFFVFSSEPGAADVQAACDKLVSVASTVKPEAELVKKYEARYQQFRKIYPAVKSLFPEII